MVFSRKTILEKAPYWMDDFIYFLGFISLSFIISITQINSLLWEGTHRGEKSIVGIHEFITITILIFIFILFSRKHLEKIEILNDLTITKIVFIFWRKKYIINLDEIKYSLKEKYIYRSRKKGSVLKIESTKKSFLLEAGVDGWSEEIIKEIYTNLQIMPPASSRIPSSTTPN